jgi:hypothetical protein
VLTKSICSITILKLEDIWFYEGVGTEFITKGIKGFGTKSFNFKVLGFVILFVFVFCLVILEF